MSMPFEDNKSRIIVVTGASGGIGRATGDVLKAAGHSVISVDLRDAQVNVDLGTMTGRQALVEKVRTLAPDGIDGIVANAAVASENSSAITVNYFGAVLTLELLRPYLRLEAPRAVVISSRALLRPVNDQILNACLKRDETLAIELAEGLPRDLRHVLYPTGKKALGIWMRSVAASNDWAGLGIALNGIAPGTIETPMTAMQSDQQRQAIIDESPMPLGGVGEAHEIASLIKFLVASENSMLSGQMLFADGGGETLLRHDDIWSTTLRPDLSFSARI